MEDHARIYVSQEMFDVGFSAHRRSMGEGSEIQYVQLSEGGPIELYTIFCGVMQAKGCHEITRTGSWPEIAANLGFVHFQGTPAMSSPEIARQLQIIYENYLLSYEEMILESSVNNIVSCWWQEHAAKVPRPYRNGAELGHWLDIISLSKKEIAERRVPEELVGTLEHWRPIFDHFLRNSREIRARKMRAMGRAALIQTVNEPSQYEDTQQASAAARKKRDRPSSAASSASSGASPSTATRAEKRLRVDAHLECCDEANQFRAEYRASRSGPTEEARTEDDVLNRPGRNISLTDTSGRSVRKPTVVHRAPNADELRDAQLWIDLCRQRVFDGAPESEPPQITEAEWPTWHSLCVEVQQVMSQLRPYWATVICELGERDAELFVNDLAMMDIQQRYLDRGLRRGMFAAWRLKLIREDLHLWLRRSSGFQG